jgi:hypothetical protein
MVSGQLHVPAALPPAPVTSSAVSLCDTKAEGVRLCVGWDVEMLKCCVVGWCGVVAGREDW